MEHIKLYKNAFLIGCDKSQEWLLPWFFENYYKHNTTPVIFADFGISNKKLADKADTMIDCADIKEQGWFKKPSAMLKSPAEKTVWLDLDCEIILNIEGIFDLLVENKLCMVIDEWVYSRKKSRLFNSGVVGYIGKPAALKSWAAAIRNKPKRGDQETLFDIDPRGQTIYELPQEYNWLRLTLENNKKDSNKKKIMHWTGPTGKKRIKEKIRKKNA